MRSSTGVRAYRGDPSSDLPSRSLQCLEERSTDRRTFTASTSTSSTATATATAATATVVGSSIAAAPAISRLCGCGCVPSGME